MPGIVPFDYKPGEPIGCEAAGPGMARLRIGSAEVTLAVADLDLVVEACSLFLDSEATPRVGEGEDEDELRAHDRDAIEEGP